MASFIWMQNVSLGSPDPLLRHIWLLRPLPYWQCSWCWALLRIVDISDGSNADTEIAIKADNCISFHFMLNLRGCQFRFKVVILKSLNNPTHSCTISPVHHMFYVCQYCLMIQMCHTPKVLPVLDAIEDLTALENISLFGRGLILIFLTANIKIAK